MYGHRPSLRALKRCTVLNDRESSPYHGFTWRPIAQSFTTVYEYVFGHKALASRLGAPLLYALVGWYLVATLREYSMVHFRDFGNLGSWCKPSTVPCRESKGGFSGRQSGSSKVSNAHAPGRWRSQAAWPWASCTVSDTLARTALRRKLELPTHIPRAAPRLVSAVTVNC